MGVCVRLSWVKTLGGMARSFDKSYVSLFTKLANGFSKWLYPFPFSPAARESQFHHILIHPWYARLFFFSLLLVILGGGPWYLTVVLIYISCMTTGVECFVIYLFAICVSLVKYLLPIFKWHCLLSCH